MDGVDLSIDGTARKNMSYVMQNELFFEDLTLRETLVVGVEWHAHWSWYKLTRTHMVKSSYSHRRAPLTASHHLVSIQP